MDQDGHRRRLRRLASGRRAWHEQAPAEAADAREAGMSISEIARLLKITRAGVHDLLRRAGVAALLAVALIAALPGASAEATVIDSPNSTFQFWTDRARVPTPQGAPLRVYEGHPSEAADYGCAHGAVLGCASRSGEWMFVATGFETTRFTFLHELGHIFDARHGTETMRARFMRIVRRDTWIGSAEEVFADLYADCARHGLHPSPNARSVSARMHRQGCRLIRSV